MKNKKLYKWTEVYPQGTTEGDEEQRLFISLVRNPKYTWRSISALIKESSLSRERVEQILLKYYNKGMVFPNPKNSENWGYWERNPNHVQKDSKSLDQSDKESRIRKAGP